MAQGNGHAGIAVGLQLPADLIEAIADAVAAKIAGGALSSAGASPYLDVSEAAEYLRGSKQRVYELVSAGAITPRRDGRRLLFHRDHLDAYLAGGEDA